MINSLALAALEKAINSYINLDPETATKLSPMQGKVIQLDISDFPLGFYIVINNQQFQLQADHPQSAQAPDVILSGKLMSLVRVGVAGADGKSLFKERISITGDTELGEKLRDILQQIDIDWEEHVSRIIGDIATHKLAYGLKQLKQFSQHARGTVGDNVTEYLQQEAACLPSALEVEQLYRDIGSLRDDVERAEARINRLVANHSESPS